jgi:hypothetical protein
VSKSSRLNGIHELPWLEEELVLHVDSIFNEIAAKSRQAGERSAIRRRSAASHGDVRKVDDQPIVVRSIETVTEGHAEFFDEIMGLQRRGIK